MPHTAIGFDQWMATIRMGTSTTAVSSRATRLLKARSFGRDRPQLDLIRREPETALATLVRGDRVHEIGTFEVRPHRVGEVELRVRGFPQEKVRQALLARRPDDEIEGGEGPRAK